MIKAAIFDVDGTLFDSMPFWMNAGKNFLQSLGSTTTEDLGNVLLSMSLEEGAEYLVKNYLPNMTASEVLGLAKQRHPLQPTAQESLAKVL